MHGKLLATTGALLVAPLWIALASPATELVVFGDSLSDNGNAAIALAAAGEPSLASMNYAANALTDGPNTSPATSGPFGLWIDQFATKLGVSDPQPYLANPFSNTNYAVASAQTGTANLQDIGNQLKLFTAGNLTGAPSNALYAIWGGANDVIDSTPANIATVGKTAADNLYQYILTLSSEGAKNFLWLNLPNLGDTPLGASLGVAGAAALNAATAQFNGELALDLATLKSDGINVTGVDINTLFNNILMSPSTYGFKDAHDHAQGVSGNPNDYVFWDTEHPTTAADTLIADTVYDAYSAPEPLSAGLSIIGFIAVLAAVKLRRKPMEV
jgi:phospholipase/lecithinase/hemolysin